MLTNFILSVAGIIFAIDRIQSYLAKNSKTSRENEQYSKETVATLKETLASREVKIQELINEHNIERLGWDKQKALMQKDIDGLKLQNNALVDKAFNKELLTKIEKTQENQQKVMEKLAGVVLQFTPLIADGGMLQRFETNDSEMMKKLDDILALLGDERHGNDSKKKTDG